MPSGTDAMHPRCTSSAAMCGMVESLNVSASAAILIYMLSSRMRETVPDWRLTAGERAEILYRWTFASVRDAEAILRRKYPEE